MLFTSIFDQNLPCADFIMKLSPFPKYYISNFYIYATREWAAITTGVTCLKLESTTNLKTLLNTNKQRGWLGVRG